MPAASPASNLRASRASAREERAAAHFQPCCCGASCDCIRSGSGRGEHALAAARVGCKNESSAAHTSRAQVLKLKSLLSRAEIEKRSLQQQLDLKVRAAAVDTRAAAVNALTHARQTSENKDLARICDELLSGMEKS